MRKTLGEVGFLVLLCVACFFVWSFRDSHEEAKWQQEIAKNNAIEICLDGKPADSMLLMEYPGHIVAPVRLKLAQRNSSWCAQIPSSRLEYGTESILHSKVTDGTAFTIGRLDDPPLGPYEFTDGRSPKIQFTRSKGHPDAIPSWMRIDVTPTSN